MERGVMRKYHAPCEAGEKSEIISETYLSLFKVVNEKKGISWIKTSKPWDNPFAERGIRTIKYENLNQVWIRNLCDFKTFFKVIKLHYNEYRPHQSFDNKTPVQVRIEANKQQKYLHPNRGIAT
jgi:transposase InsO family protein